MRRGPVSLRARNLSSCGFLHLMHCREVSVDVRGGAVQPLCNVFKTKPEFPPSPACCHKEPKPQWSLHNRWQYNKGTWARSTMRCWRAQPVGTVFSMLCFRHLPMLHPQGSAYHPKWIVPHLVPVEDTLMRERSLVPSSEYLMSDPEVAHSSCAADQCGSASPFEF